MGRGDLTDAEWHILKPLLPNRGERGPAVADKRRTVNGIVWVLRTGARWRDMPKRYGNWNSVLVRFSRWSKLGVWDADFETMASLGPPADEEHAIESTIVRAHQHAAGVKGGIKRSKCSAARTAAFRPKSTSAPNAKGNPLAFDVTGGEAHEVKGYEALVELHDVDPDRLPGDKGYDSGAIRDDLTKRGVKPVIPPRSNCKTPIEYD